MTNFEDEHEEFEGEAGQSWTSIWCLACCMTLTIESMILLSKVMMIGKNFSSKKFKEEELREINANKDIIYYMQNEHCQKKMDWV